jgi:hypothetical protein
MRKKKKRVLYILFSDPPDHPKLDESRRTTSMMIDGYMEDTP